MNNVDDLKPEFGLFGWKSFYRKMGSVCDTIFIVFECAATSNRNSSVVVATDLGLNYT
jgi:hypothetical protein